MATVHPITTRLAKNAESSVVIPLAGFAGNLVFIDIIMASGASAVPSDQHPEIGLTFLNTSGGEINPGDPLDPNDNTPPITAPPGVRRGTGASVNEIIFDGTTAPEVALDILFLELSRRATPFGRYRLELSPVDPTTNPASVRVRIKNRADNAIIIGAEGAQPRWFTCFYATTAADLEGQAVLFRPGGFEDFSATSSIIHQKVGHSLPFANIGTGGTVTLGGSLPNGSAFSLPEPSKSAGTGITDAALKVDFTGKSPGITTDTLTLTQTPGSPTPLALKAAAGRVEVVFLGDASGSMGLSEEGSFSPAAGDSRWNHLQFAVQGFAASLASLLPETPAGSGVFKPGLVEMFVFSDGDSATSLLPNGNALPIDGQWSNSEDDVNTWFSQPEARPGGGTAFFTAVRSILGPVGSASEFLDGENDVAFNRRYLVAMTDGASNTGLTQSQFIADNAALFEPTEQADGRTFAGAKNVHFIGVPYGKVGGVDVRPESLSAVADLGGDLHHVFTNAKVQGTNPGGSSLQAAFRSALQTTLAGTASDDPFVEINANAPRFTRDRLVTSADRRIEFYVYLPEPNAQLVMRVYAPDCTAIHNEISGVRIYRDARHRILSVDLEAFRGSGLTAVGTWRMAVELQPIIGRAQQAAALAWRVPFLFDHTLISDLTLEVPDGLAVAGEPIQLEGRLRLRGQPVPHASLSVHFDQPTVGASNYLAGTPVDAALLEQAKRDLAGKDATDEVIKAYALTLAQQSFDARPVKTRLDFDDPSNSGNYSLTIANTFVPGTYKLRVVAVGELDNGELYRREQFVSVVVVAKPTADASLVTIDYTRDANGKTSALVRVEPKDAFDNRLFFDPTGTGLVQITADKATATAVVNNFDGSYTRTLTFDAGQSPKIDVVVDGAVLLDDEPVPPFDDLRWLDKIKKYRPGREAAPGANQHTDPKTLLGDVRFDEPDEFLSLGGRGSVSGSFGRGVRGAKELWVFTQRDERPEAYKVEVRIDGEWRVLGRGTGTRRFKIGKHEHHAKPGFAPAVAQLGAHTTHGPGRPPHGGPREIEEVRITDLSNDILQTNGQASPSPGVSVRAVGVLIRDGGH